MGWLGGIGGRGFSGYEWPLDRGGLVKFESKLVRYTLTRAKELYEFFVDDIEFFIKIASLAIVGSRQSALDIKKIP